MIKPKLILDFLNKNLAKTGNPLGIENALVNKWWEKKRIKSEGEWLFFTGSLYQLTPYIESLVKYIEKLENSKLQSILKFANFSSSLNSYLLRAMTPKNAIDEVNRILTKIYDLLNTSVDVFYIPEIDLYSGILLYELGDDRNFVEHSRSLIEKLERSEIKKIVTADPHTTYALKFLYPKLFGTNFEVRSYLELIEPKQISRNEEFVIHDPCYYGRTLEISDLVRKQLKKARVNYREVRYSGKLTNCCGGPIEALSPKISKAVADLRVKELGSSKILTMCPICLANLRRVKAKVVDISEVLANGTQF